jgi:hypothetical protein
VKRYLNCIVCGKPKEIPKRPPSPPMGKRGRPRKASNYVAPEVYEQDPYCSRACCEADHGIEDPKSPLYSSAGQLGRQDQRSASAA